MSWDDFGVRREITDVVKTKLRFECPTAVQERTIPLFTSHQDVFVQAPTGSGKTIAFVLPVLELLSRREEKWGQFEVGAIVVVPNRELGLQIHDVLAPFLEGLPFRQVVFCGKRKITVDVKEFREQGANIVIGTPGRLETLLEASTEEFSLLNYVKSLEVLILDEADRLLEKGFSKSMDKIFSTLTKQRRTGLFSATLTDQVEEVIKVGMRNPVKVIIDTADQVLPTLEASSSMCRMPKSIRNCYTIVPENAKLVALAKLIIRLKSKKVLVFMSTCACVDYFGNFLRRLLCKHTEILTMHGRIKAKRNEIFKRFRDLDCGVLISTDVMARGIDVPNIDWVVQMDLPRVSSWFIHRCGRTARYKHRGNAIIFLTPSEFGYVKYLRRNQKVAFRQIKLRCSEDTCMRMMDKLRFKAVGDREFLEKGSRAFVSYIQSYLKHDCQILCNLKDLDVVKVAHCFGVLRLPRMPELDGRDFRTFLRCPVNTADIPYRDKKKEAQRQKMLKKRRIENEKYFTALRAKAKVDDEGGSGKRDDAELINEDYRLLKRFKRKKISTEEFEQKFYKNKK